MLKRTIQGLFRLFGCALHSAGAIERLSAERSELIGKCLSLQAYSGTLEQSGRALEEQVRSLSAANRKLEAQLRSVLADLEAERAKTASAKRQLSALQRESNAKPSHAPV